VAADKNNRRLSWEGWNMKAAVRLALPAWLVLTSILAAQTRDSQLQAPVQVMADGAPLDVQRSGHSAPCWGDFDGDGVNDLLVGQFEEGWLRIYRNQGTNARPQFSGHEWFRAGAQLGRVPSG
jgi:hypothetical protein